MKKLVGLSVFFVILYVLVLVKVDPENWCMNNVMLLRTGAQYGIVCLGVGTLIIAGGIDLSMGSLIALSGAVIAVGLQHKGWSSSQAVVTALALGVGVGMVHGLIVTKLNVQPFIVTLCGLFGYRSLARWYTGERTASAGKHPEFSRAFSQLEIFGLPVEFYFLLLALAGFGILLHRTVYGRYLFAIGANETAARYSGIRVDRYKILAYVICSLTAVFYSIMKLAETNSVMPSTFGQLIELYAIAGAVLGGCSLRGGDGNAIGIVLGVAVLTLLAPVVRYWLKDQSLDGAVIGLALLAGAILDEQLRARGLKNKARVPSPG